MAPSSTMARADEAAKRAFDVAASTVGLIVLMPLLAVLGVLVKATSRGPALFRQQRIGRHGRPFSICKLRTMTDAAGGPEVTAGGDARVTPVGRFLRRYKLDELPQLWNVWRGDMSLVGPRPEVPRYVARYNDEDRRVLSVRPGITDPASLWLRHEEELLARFEDRERAYFEVILPLKLELQRAYLQQRNLGRDVLVIFQTLARL